MRHVTILTQIMKWMDPYWGLVWFEVVKLYCVNALLRI